MEPFFFWQYFLPFKVYKKKKKKSSEYVSFSLFFSYSYSFFIETFLKMINYFIINKLGTVLYQSAQGKRNNSTTGSINDSQRIRYLPLLVIKDLIKANLNNVIQYVRIGNKTVAFKEVLERQKPDIESTIYLFYLLHFFFIYVTATKLTLCCLYQKDEYANKLVAAPLKSDAPFHKVSLWTTLVITDSRQCTVK